MKYYIIAGEASGDMHGANLIHELKKMDNDSFFQFFGGDKMQSASGNSAIKHISELAFMGFVEVIFNLRTILKNISICKESILEFQPDALILIDYPGFNLRIAKWAKKNGIKVYYYISPQIWAWKTNRIHSLMDVSEKMFVILPFEKDFYKKYNYDVDAEFVGHPLLDEIKKNEFKKIEEEKPIIALLPGSRKQEINKMLPVMIQLVDAYPNYQFCLAAAASIPKDFYLNLIQNKKIKIIENNTYGLLDSAFAAIVTSGTATLETGLFQVPQVVCYKGNEISFWIAKRLVKNIKYISLVNLILDKLLVTELIQDDFNSTKLKEEFNKILEEKNRIKIGEGYKRLQEKLSKENASQNVAQSIVEK